MMDRTSHETDDQSSPIEDISLSPSKRRRGRLLALAHRGKSIRIGALLLIIIGVYLFFTVSQAPITVAQSPIPGHTETATDQDCVDCHVNPQKGELGALDVGASAIPIVSTHSNIDFITRTQETFEFGCTDCHAFVHGDGPNIKLIGEYVVVSPTLGATTGPISFTALTGPQSFDDGASDPASRICKTCHINATRSGSGSGLIHSGAAGHSEIGDVSAEMCTDCHPHNLDGNSSTKDGFMWACGNCHGKPPVDAGTLVTNPAMGTGSTTAGAHNAHVNTEGFLCNDCHANSAASGVTHNNGLTITLGFAPFGGGLADGGAYDGQTTANYESSYTGTTVSNLGAKQCSNLYCHGNYNGSGLNATPVWDTPSSGDCGTCHRASNSSTPSTGKHSRHAGSGSYGFECTLCHQDIITGSGPSGYSISSTVKHVSGYVDWRFDTSDPRVSISSTYSITSGTAAPSNGVTPRSYGTCDNVYCHSNVQPEGGVGPPSIYGTPNWRVSSSCSGCHEGGHGNLINSGSHTEHLVYTFTTSAAWAKCNTCHKWNTGAGLNDCNSCHFSYEYAEHVDYEVDVVFDATFGGTYNGTLTPGDGYSNCANTYCHSNGASVSTGSVPTNTSPVWGTGTLACNACHGYGPNYANGLPKANSHSAHSNYGCNNCHFETTSNGITITNKTTHVNKQYNLQSGTGITFSYAFASGGGTCSNISCHSGNSATWGTTISCVDCHRGTGDVDDFIFNNGTTARIDASEWISTGHGLTGTSTYSASGNSGAGLNACDYCHDNTVPHNQGTNPFRLANTGGADGQNGACWACHKTGASGYDPPGASALVTSNLKIDSYHYGAKHGVDNNGGSLCWDCHDPHGDTNIYMAHDAVTQQSDGTYGTPITTVAVIFTSNTTGTDYAKSSSPYNGICNVCHTVANHYTSISGDGHNQGAMCVTCHLHSAADPESAFSHGGGSGGAVCIQCHGHDAATNYDEDRTAPNDGSGGASQGKGTTQSHSTHTEIDTDDTKGPDIYCDTCHDINNFPNFNSGTDVNGDGKYNLAETDVCDTCHSPGGTYDGIDDPVIGAKNNWDTGVYTAGSSLMSGKEKWCATCHDEEPSVVLTATVTVTAPNVIGDEDQAFDYGTGYGFYKTGHGLPTTEFYPWTIKSGSPLQRRGAGATCDSCHDFSVSHTDGQARTYTQPGTPASFQSGYRLKSINGQVPLEIPRTNLCPWEVGYGDQDPVEVDDFRLCFSCHDSQPFISVISDTTNFRNESSGVNAHYDHLAPYQNCGPGPMWASDWSGGMDSRVTCSICHNVHGSVRLSMVNDGKLVDKEPGLRVAYDGPGVTYQCGGPGTHDPTPPNLTLPDSTGTIWDANVGNLCSACHGSCGFNVLYTRVPFTNPPPSIDKVYGRVGGDILAVHFSENVYSNSDATGNLVSADFVLTDTDNSRTIAAVTHTAGDDIAQLTLSAPLDASNDIGTDTLAAATNASIYDYTGQAMDTTAVVIEGDSTAPVVSNQYPLNSASGVATETNVTLTLSDTQSGIAWTTFSIQLSGSKGYTKTYTDADTAIVSKTGTFTGYDVVVNPDTDFGVEEIITVTVDVADLVGNSLTPPDWSFTTESVGAPQTMILHPSGLNTQTGGWATSPADTWATSLDSNDGDTTYAVLCCTSPDWTFFVDMDNPTGLDTATIQSLTFHVYARYRSSPSPAGTPFAADVNIGYKTGTNTVWRGDYTTDTSGNYNLISSISYTTDSDGGALDLTDINNLQLAVERANISGSPQLRVTEVYAEITYIPGSGSQPPAPQAMVMDNTEAVFTGEWLSGSGSDQLSALDHQPDHYGPDFQFHPSGDGSSTTTWTPDISQAGDYNVYAWWAAGEDRATDAPYTIYYNGESEEVRVNQQLNGGQWNLLGSYPFAAGTSGYVQLSDDADGYVIADAVMFEEIRGTIYLPIILK